MFCMKLCRCALVLILLPLLSGAQQKDHGAYTVDHGIVYSDDGIPESPRWFADSRLAFQLDEAGIAQVDYYPAITGQTLATLFLRQLWDGFRYYLEQDGKTYKPVYAKSKVWPFGIESDWNFNGVVLKQRVMAVDEAIVLQIVVPDNIPSGIRFKLEFFENFALTRGSPDDFRFSNGGNPRKWEPWKFSADLNVLETNVLTTPLPSREHADPKPFQTYCLIAADFPQEHSERPINAKHLLKSPVLESGKTYSFVVGFDLSQEVLRTKSADLIKNLPQRIEQQVERYRKVAENSPQLKSPYAGLDDFISLAPGYHESLKITGHPGAIRAKTTSYWVWGWDGITSNYATAYWGDVVLIRDMLSFYEATADKDKGIGHGFDFDMKPNSISALPAQGMYVSLLQLYYANSGDIALVKQRYPFAKIIFDRMAAAEVGKTGLSKGTSLFPDFPEAMSETGDDISGFNNTVFYCAARSMEFLATLTGDKEQQKKAGAVARRFEKHFMSLFFNAEKKFIVSSIDAKTLQQRDSYNTNAIRWENNYCADLTDSMNVAALDFFKKNAVTAMGLREIPLWNKSYDMDANQLHCWWPATGEYFIRLINENNQKPLVDQWVKWVSYWIKHLSVPEGISYYIETDEPEFDRWTSLKGTWQGYSMRGWYQAAMHGVVGVGTDAGGVTFYPYDGEEMTLTGLNYRGKKFDIEWKGRGRYIESIEAAGMIIKGTHKLPADVYKNKERISVVVKRVEANPYPVTVATGVAVALQDYKYSDGVIRANLDGVGFTRLKFNAARLPVVKVKGRRVPVVYNAELHTAFIELNLRPGDMQAIEIR